MEITRDSLESEDIGDLKSHGVEAVGPEELPYQTGKTAKERQTCSYIHYCPLLSISWRNVTVIKLKIHKCGYW